MNNEDEVGETIFDTVKIADDLGIGDSMRALLMRVALTSNDSLIRTSLMNAATMPKDSK